jgi:hypothetical protein
MADLVPIRIFWTALENRPLSRLSGYLQKKRGVRADLPDTLIMFPDPQHGFPKPICIELKSSRGVLSKKQRQVAAELQANGATVWVARTVSAALTALHLSGVPLPPRLEPWEGPFPHTPTRLPQYPRVAAERRAARQRARERQRRAREIPQPQERMEAAQ